MSKLPSGSGTTEKGTPYTITSIDDRDTDFCVAFTYGESRAANVGFPTRPAEREQLEYAHDCVRGYVSDKQY